MIDVRTVLKIILNKINNTKNCHKLKSKVIDNIWYM